jgi:hypothetical protein
MHPIAEHGEQVEPAQKCGVCEPRRERALTNLIDAIREYRKLADQPLTLRGSEHARAVQQTEQGD